jgi:hypothetical protein
MLLRPISIKDTLRKCFLPESLKKIKDNKQMHRFVLYLNLLYSAKTNVSGKKKDQTMIFSPKQ